MESVQRSRQFYERLGWHRSSASNESIVFFRAGGIALALYPLAELAKDANLSADGQGFGGITLAYNGSSRDDVDWVLSEAVKAEATLLKPAQEAFSGGYSGYFADPDRFPWQAASNPLTSELLVANRG